MMSIPQYIQDSASYITFIGQTVDNQSLAQFNQQRLTLSKDGEYYLYFDNYNYKDVTITVEKEANVKVYLLSYYSRKSEMDIKVHVKDNALLKLYSQFTARRKTKVHVNRQFDVDNNASLILLNNLTFHGEFSLNEQIFLKGQQANLALDLLNINGVDDQSKVVQHVYHQAEKTYSQINNWLISNHNSKLNYVVNGTIEKGKAKSSCEQLNKGIILSDDGQIRVVPSLYIDEYDVVASHGAAIGQIDENQMFYLTSRGLTEFEAKNLIVSGYINPFLIKIKNKRLEALLKRRVKHLL